MKVCKYCNKEIEGSHSVYANHVRWCDKNKTNGDKGGNKISEAKKKYYEENRKEIEHNVICNRCFENFKPFHQHRTMNCTRASEIQ